ncbi:hypothetical protein P5673_026681 [Acropora cervicornis]|uniref:Uncharacterized protein n=1 Tax=Acropora cervicornis TaxID=6130 RepID=A0AAD9Q0D7_ACRCE|nr:hypothetical protein P5673_026681 [Acropora cervicornis]
MEVSSFKLRKSRDLTTSCSSEETSPEGEVETLVLSGPEVFERKRTVWHERDVEEASLVHHAIGSAAEEAPKIMLSDLPPPSTAFAPPFTMADACSKATWDAMIERDAIGESILTQTVPFKVANLINERPVGRHPRSPKDGSYLCPNYPPLGCSTTRVPSGPYKESINPRLWFE